jgi:sulfur carrier protein
MSAWRVRPKFATSFIGIGARVSQTMNVIVNGTPSDLPAASTVAELVKSMGLSPALLAVEVNLEIVPRSRHGQHVLRDGDKVEVVTLAGGG